MRIMLKVSENSFRGNIVGYENVDGLSFDIDKVIRICRDNDAAMVGVFVSVARGRIQRKVI